jgi:hypothetical protein
MGSHVLLLFAFFVCAFFVVLALFLVFLALRNGIMMYRLA